MLLIDRVEGLLLGLQDIERTGKPQVSIDCIHSYRPQQGANLAALLDVDVRVDLLGIRELGP